MNSSISSNDMYFFKLWLILQVISIFMLVKWIKKVGYAVPLRPLMYWFFFKRLKEPFYGSYLSQHLISALGWGLKCIAPSAYVSNHSCRNPLIPRFLLMMKTLILISAKVLYLRIRTTVNLFAILSFTNISWQWEYRSQSLMISKNILNVLH